MYDSIYAQEVPEHRIISDLFGCISSILKNIIFFNWPYAIQRHLYVLLVLD